MKKVIIVIVVMLFGAVLFAGCGNSRQNNTPVNNQTQQTVKGKVGEILSLPGDTQIIVKRTVKNPEDSNMILAEVEIKNISNTPKIYSFQNFTLKDKNGKTYASSIVKVPNPIITTNLLPGKTLSGFVGFTVPQGEKEFTLVFSGASGNIEISFSEQN